MAFLNKQRIAMGYVDILEGTRLSGLEKENYESSNSEEEVKEQLESLE